MFGIRISQKDERVVNPLPREEMWKEWNSIIENICKLLSQQYFL
jgi:hypothetical protein